MESISPISKLIFISYNSADELVAADLYDVFKSLGSEVFYAPASLQVGQSFIHEINQALDRCQLGVVVWSKTAAQSRWVLDEISALTDRRNRGQVEIAIIRLDNAEVPALLRHLQRIDLTGSPGDIRQIALRVVGALPAPAQASVPALEPPIKVKFKRSPFPINDLGDDVVMLLAKQFKATLDWMESGRCPAVVSAEFDGCRYVAEVNLANLQARSLVRSLNNALELVEIHSEMLDRLRKIEGDPTMIFFPVGLKINERRESLANEIQAIRVTFATFFSRVWKDEV